MRSGFKLTKGSLQLAARGSHWTVAHGSGKAAPLGRIPDRWSRDTAGTRQFSVQATAHFTSAHERPIQVAIPTRNFARPLFQALQDQDHDRAWQAYLAIADNDLFHSLKNARYYSLMRLFSELYDRVSQAAALDKASATRKAAAPDSPNWTPAAVRAAICMMVEDWFAVGEVHRAAQLDREPISGAVKVRPGHRRYPEPVDQRCYVTMAKSLCRVGLPENACELLRQLSSVGERPTPDMLAAPLQALAVRGDINALGRFLTFVETHRFPYAPTAYAHVLVALWTSPPHHDQFWHLLREPRVARNLPPVRCLEMITAPFETFARPRAQSVLTWLHSSLRDTLDQINPNTFVRWVNTFYRAGLHGPARELWKRAIDDQPWMRDPGRVVALVETVHGYDVPGLHSRLEACELTDAPRVLVALAHRYGHFPDNHSRLAALHAPLLAARETFAVSDFNRVIGAYIAAKEPDWALEFLDAMRARRLSASPTILLTVAPLVATHAARVDFAALYRTLDPQEPLRSPAAAQTVIRALTVAGDYSSVQAIYQRTRFPTTDLHASELHRIVHDLALAGHLEEAWALTQSLAGLQAEHRPLQRQIVHLVTQAVAHNHRAVFWRADAWLGLNFRYTQPACLAALLRGYLVFGPRGTFLRHWTKLGKRIRPDRIPSSTWATVVMTLNDRDRHLLAYIYYQRMREAGHPPTPELSAQLVFSSHRLGRPDLAQFYLRQHEQAGLPIMHPAIGMARVAGLVAYRDYKAAVALYDELSEQGHPFDAQVFGVLTIALIETKTYARAARSFHEGLRQGFVPDATIQRYLLLRRPQCYLDLLPLPRLHAAFVHRLKAFDRDIGPTWNALFTVYLHAQDSSHLRELADYLATEQVGLDAASIDLLYEATTLHDGLDLDLVDQVRRRHGYPHTARTCGSLMEHHCARQRPEQALAVLVTLVPEQAVEPDERLVHTLLRVLLAYNQLAVLLEFLAYVRHPDRTELLAWVESFRPNDTQWQELCQMGTVD
ncbi:hypothetical protein IWQ60_010686 [Tieghemiomyces parasiticus]|uniref:Uncharacterized protein n=1 Tax=Tieghemiomyces parasiticus TaxID=78921 RepID=A0A9W8DML6_9FUNG|nr:hypothetical protein IWQ60_010686 [Tieghemiomyces parasiticus]